MVLSSRADAVGGIDLQKRYVARFRGYLYVYYQLLESSPLITVACPHTGFLNPQTDPSEPPRESIECRAILFFADVDELPQELRTISGAHI